MGRSNHSHITIKQYYTSYVLQFNLKEPSIIS